jgi:2-keto-4-pentenoate hydratase/2-oxohepta-3-ene-1,7-dioic acid hydratase in catechol pathway
LDPVEETKGSTHMRWARFALNGTPTYGVVEGDTVIPVRGSPFDGWERTPARLAFADVKLLVPVVPSTFYACGMNYPEHVREVAEKIGQKPNLPTQPDIGYRANNALIAHGETIVIPKDATAQVQYEGELVAVIGRKCTHLTRENALTAVMGWTIGNDVSERSWQKSDRTMWRSKNTDTFKPMGPWIETDVKLDALVTRVRINGKQMLEFKTNDMVFGVERYIAEITKYMTLHPGDVIWMGTEGSNADMKAGDVCEIELDQIGTLRNPVVAEQPR